MSTWNLGKDDVSEQTQALKDAASSKECENADLRGQLFKRDNELNELKSTLNETLRKLSREADRALSLESDLNRISEDLTFHKLASQNAERALEATNAKLHISELNERELQSHVEILSTREDSAKENTTKLAKEKKVLEARVRELDAEVRQLSVPTSTIPRRGVRGRSSSVSIGNLKSTAVEQELSDVRASLTAKESDLRSATEKLSRLQTQLVQAQNEQIATEKKMKKQLSDLEASVEEKEDELERMRAQQEVGGQEREEELMKRIEEDEAKIAALEILAGDSYKMASIKDALHKTERQLKAEIEKSEETEKRCIELAREKEEALDELEEARKDTHMGESKIQLLTAKETELRSQITNLQSSSRDRVLDSTIEPSQSNSTPSATSDPKAATYIATLLSAIDRLRGERDNLRRDLNFLESESKFAVQALEAKVASVPPLVNDAKAQTETLLQHTVETRRLGLAATATAIVVSHLQLQLEGTSTEVARVEGQLADANTARENQDNTSKSLQADLDIALQDLEAASAERATLLEQLESKTQVSSDEVEKLSTAHAETKDALKEAEAQLSDVTKSLEEAESERDSLHLQVTNLQTDLALAQEDLTEAENRYSVLQAQQLSSMSSSDVARSLREQIEELEMRVLRRTEQIGIHQHDIKRLETNLRLQEERVGEMTVELETLGAQKEAMVEDCADAREARDEAIEKCETLELDVEGLEAKLERTEEEREQELSAMVAIIMETVARSRRAFNKVEMQSTSDISYLDAQQAILALAISQVEIKSRSTCLLDINKANIGLQSRVFSLEGQLTDKVSQFEALGQQLDDLRILSSAGADVEAQTMAQLHSEYTEKLSVLQNKLTSVVSELEETKSQQADSEARHNQAIEEAYQSKQELEDRLVNLSTRVVEAEGQLEAELEQARADHLEESNRMQEQITRVNEELKQAIRSHSEAESAHQATLTELTMTREEYEARLSRAALQTLDATRQLEDDFANMRLKHAEALGELEDQLKYTVEEISRLQIRLQQEVESRDKDRQTHMMELQSKTEECRRAESLEAELHHEVATTRTQLDQTRTVLQALEAEKSTLQIESTNLAAEIQRTISLNRFMEKEVKDFESRNVSLEETLNLLRAELSRSEKSGKEAEINLSLQTVRHEQVVSGLRRELATLKATPRLDEVVAELEERNRDMDELLRNKCAEIEENDDRVLVMLKDKKKLTAKVESLTRKVQTLQNKLALTQEPPATGFEKLISPTPRSAPSNTITPMPRMDSTPPVPPIPVQNPKTRPVSNRVVSGPASLPRPKTPERRQVPPAVFKARTPEKRMTPKATPPALASENIPPSSSSSSAGKKRARPDEFDEVSAPVRALYAEDQQERETSTPRLRRALQSVHTGFTPVRQASVQPAYAAPSPGRRVTYGAAGIADVTNSPRSMAGQAAKAGKRSWLGKIRGVSTQTSSGSRTPSSRPGIFDRVPGS